MKQTNRIAALLSAAILLCSGSCRGDGNAKTNEDAADGGKNPFAMTELLDHSGDSGASGQPAETAAPAEVGTAEEAESAKEAAEEAPVTVEGEAEAEAVPGKSCYLLEHGERFICPYRDRIYGLGENLLTAYDPADGMRCEVLADYSGETLFPGFDSFPHNRLAAQGEELALFLADRIRICSLDGETVRELPLPMLTPEEGEEARFWEADLYALDGVYYAWCSFASAEEEEEAAASRRVFLRIDPESGDVRELGIHGEDVECLYSLAAGDKKDCLTAAAEVRIPGMSGVCVGLVRYDLKKEWFEDFKDWGTRSSLDFRMQIDPSDGTVWGAAGETLAVKFLRWRGESRDEEVIARLSRDSLRERIERETGASASPLIRGFFWTGREFLFYDSESSVLVAKAAEPDSDSGRTLTILWPDVTSNMITNGLLTVDNPVAHKLELALSRFSDETGSDARTVRYPKQEFNRRVQMKMLAGDDDFDLVYEQDGREMIGPLIRNALYLPLETDPEIVRHFGGNYLPGIREIMTTDDGHLWGVPYTLAVTGILSPSDSAGETGYDAGSLAAAENFIVPLLINIAEDGLRNGRLDRDRVLSVFEDSASLPPAGLTDVRVPAQDIDPAGQWESAPKTEGKTLLPLPDNNYADVSCYIFAYRNTPVPHLALSYLRLLTDEFWVTLYEPEKTCMAAAGLQYHAYAEGFSFRSEPEDTPISLGKDSAALNRMAGSLLASCRCGLTGLWDRDAIFEISGIAERVRTGAITPEAGADEFVSRIGIRLFE